MDKFSSDSEMWKILRNFPGNTLRFFSRNHVLSNNSKTKRFTEKMSILIKIEQETAVLLSYSEIELECKYRYKSENIKTFIFFTKLTFSPKVCKVLKIWQRHLIKVIKLYNFPSIHYFNRTNSFVVKWQEQIRLQFWWKFSGHKITKKKFVSDPF